MLSKRNLYLLSPIAGIGLGIASYLTFFKPDAFKDQLQTYYEEYYGKMDLPKEAIEQLSWLKDEVKSTPERNAILTSEPNDLHTEIKRCLSRWNCLKLFLDGSEKAYLEFVRDQEHQSFLREEEFRIFSDIIHRLSPAAREALKASCFIVKSQVAKDQADAANVKYIDDSELFVSAVLQQQPDIYPLYRELIPLSQGFLPYAFIHATHLRHMMYTEGGENMFNELRTLIKNRQLSQEEFDLWFCRWLINTAALRGHENPRGSIYLTRHTATSLLLLREQLIQLWSNPNADVLAAYLKKQGERLHLQPNYLVHLACMMRLYHPEEAEQLKKWFEKQDRKALIKRYDEFVHNCKVTPTYMPAVLDNLRLIGFGIADTAEIFTKLAASANQAYLAAIAKRMIAPNQPLNFSALADKDFLEKRVKAPFISHGDFQVDFSFDEHGELQPVTPHFSHRLA